MRPQRTRKCPSCGYEYEPWVEVCPDCGVAIETATPPLKLVRPDGLDDNTDPEWTVAANVPNAIIGNVIKQQLEDAGIPVIMLRARSADVGEFTHNDFVPQDLRVPRDRYQEARDLVYAEPGNGPNWSGWDNELDEGDAANYENEEATDGYGSSYDSEPRRSLPDGWRMLPTERDMSEQQQMRRAHNHSSGEWHWTDPRKPQSQFSPSRLNNQELDADYSYEQEPVEFIKRDIGDSYGDYGSAPLGSSKWVRIFYAILIGSLTLPFLFQIMGQIAAIFDGR